MQPVLHASIIQKIICIETVMLQVLFLMMGEGASMDEGEQARRTSLRPEREAARTARVRQGVRWGLCCLFKEEPIHFGVRQAAHVSKFLRARQLELLSDTVLKNTRALVSAITYCSQVQIGAFRITSRIFPLKTHPQVGYALDDLPDQRAIMQTCLQAKKLARQQDIRLSFHPDQFTLLSSPNEEVTANSLKELAYQAEVAELVGADVITLHGGGAYGDKHLALQRLARNIRQLPAAIREWLALENDDRVYTPADLLPLCAQEGIPFVYDIHHHRCLPDGLSVEVVTERALATWDREPLFHLSSPKDGWGSPDPRPHHDFIAIDDIPPCWLNLPVTIEVEAKAKELALRQLLRDLLALSPPAHPAG